MPWWSITSWNVCFYNLQDLNLGLIPNNGRPKIFGNVWITFWIWPHPIILRQKTHSRKCCHDRVKVILRYSYWPWSSFWSDPACALLLYIFVSHFFHLHNIWHDWPGFIFLLSLLASVRLSPDYVMFWTFWIIIVSDLEWPPGNLGHWHRYSETPHSLGLFQPQYRQYAPCQYFYSSAEMAASKSVCLPRVNLLWIGPSVLKKFQGQCSPCGCQLMNIWMHKHNK